jgi:alpha-tubulin suppressor-like RCC1 family protein
MSISKNVFRLNKIYELVNAGLIDYTGGPYEPRSMFVWGDNTNAQLGLGDINHRSSPTQLSGSEWTAFFSNSGSQDSFAIKSNNTLWAWGRNSLGNLGLGDTISRSSPVQIPGTAWCKVDRHGFSNSMALKTDGTLWSWGTSYGSTIGDGSVGIHKSSPIQIPGTQWSNISSARDQSVAQKTDGTTWVWGGNGSGQLGLGDRIVRSSPTQLPGNWTRFGHSTSSMFGVKSDGTLWAWGYNGGFSTFFPPGHLGVGDTIHRSSPTQIPGTNWRDVSSRGGYSTIASKNDGTMWSWGCNTRGALGDGTINHRCSPIQIPGNEWCCISGGYANHAAMKTNGTLWAWGDNGNGILGINDTNHRCSPVQVPGIWSDICNSRGGIATKKL